MTLKIDIICCFSDICACLTWIWHDKPICINLHSFLHSFRIVFLYVQLPALPRPWFFRLQGDDSWSTALQKETTAVPGISQDDTCQTMTANDVTNMSRSKKYPLYPHFFTHVPYKDNNVYSAIEFSVENREEAETWSNSASRAKCCLLFLAFLKSSSLVAASAMSCFGLRFKLPAKESFLLVQRQALFDWRWSPSAATAVTMLVGRGTSRLLILKHRCT